MAVEQSPEGILIANVNEEIEFVNEAFILSSGYDVDELIGRKIGVIFSELTTPTAKESLWRVIQHGRSWEGEMTRRRKNGEVFTTHELYSPIRQPDGAITHLLLLQEDITEQKQLTEELENYRHYLEDIVHKRTDEVSYLYNKAPCGYHSLNQDGVVVEINDTELSWLSYTREEVVNQKSFRDIIAPHDHAVFKENYPKFMREGHIEALELDLMRKDGSFLPIVLTANAIYDKQGQFVRSLSTAFDNTESKERENRIAILNKELVEQAEQAKTATQAKSAFLANMSHEIRTPMNAVLGFCYLLKQKRLDGETLNLILKIQSAGHSLLAIINDILDLSKIEAGRLELEFSSFQLSTVIDNIAGIVGNAVGNKPLELIISPPATDKVECLIGDALRLQQILINLLSNAIKFTERGEVSLKIDVIAEQQNTMSLQFSVRDTGIGISQEMLKEIFRAFSQADTSTARQFGGTGLGLAISRQLVELMGGQLQVSSQLGQGSEFKFTIPF
jgi:PAS domain S-box-containing protein